MKEVRLIIPQVLDNGESADTVFTSLRKIIKSRIFKYPVDISSRKDGKDRSIQVRVSFFDEGERNFFLMFFGLMDYKSIVVEQDGSSQP